MTADLRRLAEQRAPNNHTASRVNYRDGKAILALLDERDGYRRMLDDSVQQQLARERRVAALEKGLRALADDARDTFAIASTVGMLDALERIEQKARALLAAAPSEPRFVRGYKFRGRPS